MRLRQLRNWATSLVLAAGLPLASMAQPANDDCGGAIALTPSPTCAPVSGTVAAATQSIPAISCAGFTGTANDDVWYSFVATATDHSIFVTTGNGFDVVIDLRSGACNGTNLTCADVVSANATEVLDATGLTVGTNYYVRLYHWGGNIPSNTSFTICVTGPAPACDADAGTITADESSLCLVEGSAIINATPDGNAVVPSGYQTRYVLTEGPALTIVNLGLAPSFTVSTPGSYTVHTLVYDPATLDLSSVEVGVTTGADVAALLIEGGGSICASLDVAGAPVLVEICETCDASAGALTADVTPVCLVDGTAEISATADGNAVVPGGYETAYVLTQGAGLVIVDVSPLPIFDVTSADTYTIHTLVYDPTTLDLGVVELGVTTGFDVNALLIQGGGTICASLDVAGAAFTVEACITCDADAGGLTADATPVCLVDGAATISATADGNAVVPSGYETTYVLTQGAGLVIVDVSTTPNFEVTAADQYTIHTLVYDPATLDLSTVELGVTTGFDVNGLLIQGGGTICASLDVTGAAIVVDPCPTCDAEAGALVANTTPVCLVDGNADIAATPDGNAVVPTGYETVYVLTQGPGLVIIATGGAPIFNVTAADQYTIHTLVYDPATLDLGIVEPGVTTGFDVNALLLQGGGSICASLDVTGALFEVTECVVCEADAGTLVADETPVCLFDGVAQIGATHDVEPTVPDGYEVAYVLTQGPGLVIVGLNPGPVFSISDEGAYTIHTIVFDPLTIDVSAIELGVTTGFDVNSLLLQGGGSICGSLDVAGAPVIVDDCSPVNDNCVSAIAVAINLAADCPANATAGDNTYATEDGTESSCEDVGATTLDVWYTFNSGENTTVVINFTNVSMEDWAIVVWDGCAGNEILCAIQPDQPIELTTDVNTDYVVQVYSNPTFGVGGEFTLCLTGDAPTVVCDGGSVQTSDGHFAVDVCQDAVADIIDFTTTSLSAENYTYLLTDESNTVIAQLVGGTLDFNSAALGTYRVWGISHNGALVGAEPGNLATEITTDGSCLDLSDNYVQVNVEICDGIGSADASAWNLFPNPGNGDFSIVYNGSDVFATLEVVDMEGRIVHQQRQAVVKGQVLPINLNGQLAMGVYTVRFTSENGSTTMRLVVR